MKTTPLMYNGFPSPSPPPAHFSFFPYSHPQDQEKCVRRLVTPEQFSEVSEWDRLHQQRHWESLLEQELGMTDLEDSA